MHEHLSLLLLCLVYEDAMSRMLLVNLKRMITLVLSRLFVGMGLGILRRGLPLYG